MDESTPFDTQDWLQEMKGPNRADKVESISTEASSRKFYRIYFTNGSTRVAMVYPESNPIEIERIIDLSGTYLKRGIRVPEIDQVIGGRVIIEEDLGDELFQTAYMDGDEKQRRELLQKMGSYIIGFSEITPPTAGPRLDHERMQRELNHFQLHFFKLFPPVEVEADLIGEALDSLLKRIPPPNVFAHRDFHSRNILIYKGQLALVDFQDSMTAPLHYDLVSATFDSYLDIEDQRDYLIKTTMGKGFQFDEDQYRLTALQRNIKALGTFAFQIVERKNLKYRESIPLTIRHILGNLKKSDFSGQKTLFRYFNSLKIK